jgi:hypothetical protein
MRMNTQLAHMLCTSRARSYLAHTYPTFSEVGAMSNDITRTQLYRRVLYARYVQRAQVHASRMNTLCTSIRQVRSLSQWEIQREDVRIVNTILRQ